MTVKAIKLEIFNTKCTNKKVTTKTIGLDLYDSSCNSLSNRHTMVSYKGGFVELYFGTDWQAMKDICADYSFE